MSSPGVQTLYTVTGILDVLDQDSGATAQIVAEELDISLSNAYDHLTTLRDLDYIVKNGECYHLGLKFLKHGVRAKRELGVTEPVEPALEELATETGEIAWFVVEEHGQAVYVAKALGEKAIQPYGRIGRRVGLHDIAAGKAILAELPRSRIREIVDEHGLPRHTENTITDREELYEELDRISERGYALNKDETMDGFRAVASPVITEETVQGAIVVSGPKARFEDDRFRSELPQKVSTIANELELRFRSQNNR